MKSSKGAGGKGETTDIIYVGPKSAETMQKERPSSDEDKTKLPLKVSASLSQILEKLEISNKAEREKLEAETVMCGTKCKNTGCKTKYEDSKTDLETCVYHPGAPVFHEGYKYWSCCCIKTIDFNAFLDQKGCTSGKHCWIAKKNKTKVACRHDWYQTGSNVMVTIYSKNAMPEHSYVEANRTMLTCHIQFENNKVFHKDFHLWGVVDVGKSLVNMVPSKVEVTLKKADAVAWGKLEDPNFKPEPEPVEDDFPVDASEDQGNPDVSDIEDDDISDSDEEWAYDKTGKKAEIVNEEALKSDLEEMLKWEKEMAEKKKKEEEEKEAERKRMEEAGEEYDPDMPDLCD